MTKTVSRFVLLDLYVYCHGQVIHERNQNKLRKIIKITNLLKPI